MARLYKGAAVGTFWHANDAVLSGLSASRPRLPHNLDNMINHIAGASKASPYLSLTHSFGVALAYATMGTVAPTAANPAFVYEIELDDPLPRGTEVFDPLQELAPYLPGPLAVSPYQHDGDPRLLLAVVAPQTPVARRILRTQIAQPPGHYGTQYPRVTPLLRTLTRVLRDAEILVRSHVHAIHVVEKHPIY